MAFLDRRTVNILCTILLFAVLLAIVYVARGVLVIFTFSILFAYLIDPVVRLLQRHSLIFRNLRGPHVAEAYLCLLILIPLAIHFVAPGSLGKTTKRVKQIPSFVAGISSGESPHKSVGNMAGATLSSTSSPFSFSTRQTSTV